MTDSSSALISLFTYLLAIAATVLACIFILPESKGKGLRGFGKVLHDLLSFKELLLEKILKVLYVFSTAYTVTAGFFMLFRTEKIYHYSAFGYENYTREWRGYVGLLVLLLGPIAVRIVYEFLLMLILAVKNIMEINQKLGDKRALSESAPTATAENTEAAENEAEAFSLSPKTAPRKKTVNFCIACGGSIDDTNKCTGCGKQY